MKSHLAAIPDDRTGQARWLEQRLVGLDWGDVVAELAVLGEFHAAPHTGELQDILGAKQDAVLQQGLAVLDERQLAQLLSSPAALLDLQELVLIEGGAFWQDLLATDEAQETDNEVTPAIHAAPASYELSVEQPTAAAKRFWTTPATMATAASVAMVALLYFSFWPPSPSSPPPANWGWLAEDALASAAPADYLRQLADGGQAWFKQRPESQAEVRERIVELRQGCQRLIDGEHRALGRPDADWLRERCLAWRDKLDMAVASLEGGAPADPLTVRGEVDDIVEKAVQMLRERARLLAT